MFAPILRYAMMGGVGFAPSDIPGLILDADPGNWTASAGNVATAPDSSSAGNDLTVTGTLAYTASDSEANGYASVTGGSGKLSRSVFTGGSAAQPSFQVFVGKWVSSASQFASDGGPTGGGRNALYSTSGQMTIYAGTVAATGKTVAASTKVTAYSSFDGAASEWGMNADGTASASGTVSVGPSPLVGITLLADYAGARQWTEKMFRHLVYSSVPSPSELTKLLNHLNSRYGIAPA